MIAEESIVVSGGQTFNLTDGGTYTMDVSGTISVGGSVQLQRVVGGGFANVGSAISSGAVPNTQNVTIARGGFKLNVVSGSSIQATITRLPPP